MRPMAYRLLLAFSLLGGALFASPSSAEIYRPWCAQYYGNNGGGTNCGFVSYEQCMMTARGAGAWCVRNPWNVAYGQGRSDRGRRAW
jgi:hypothetical protein